MLCLTSSGAKYPTELIRRDSSNLTLNPLYIDIVHANVPATKSSLPDLASKQRHLSQATQKSSVIASSRLKGPEYGNLTDGFQNSAAVAPSTRNVSTHAGKSEEHLYQVPPSIPVSAAKMQQVATKRTDSSKDEQQELYQNLAAPHLEFDREISKLPFSSNSSDKLRGQYLNQEKHRDGSTLQKGIQELNIQSKPGSNRGVAPRNDQPVYENTLPHDQMPVLNGAPLKAATKPPSTTGG
jgi:hypothetical protein